MWDPSYYIQPLYDVIVTLVMCIWIGLQSNVWLGHDTITTMDSLVVKVFMGMSALLVIIQPTYVGLVSLYG